MGIQKEILAKLTTRNILALGTIAMFLFVVHNIITENPDLLENPFVAGILGAFTTVVVMIFVFYFRTSGPLGVTELDRPPPD